MYAVTLYLNSDLWQCTLCCGRHFLIFNLHCAYWIHSSLQDQHFINTHTIHTHYHLHFNMWLQYLLHLCSPSYTSWCSSGKLAPCWAIFMLLRAFECSSLTFLSIGRKVAMLFKHSSNWAETQTMMKWIPDEKCAWMTRLSSSSVVLTCPTMMH